MEVIRHCDRHLQKLQPSQENDTFRGQPKDPFAVHFEGWTLLPVSENVFGRFVAKLACLKKNWPSAQA